MTRTSGTGRRHAVVVLILTAALAILGLSACGSTEPRSLIDSIKSGKVILGTKFDQPGLGLRNPDQTFTGFDVKVSEYVVNSIADTLKVKRPEITWRETPSAQRETLIDNGEVDMIAATYTINKERSQKVSFAGPYLVNYQGLLVRKDDTNLSSLEDLNSGKKLCSVTGSTSAQNVKAQLPNVQLQEYDSYSSCVEALRRGKVDALTTDEAILAGFSTFYPDEFKVVDMTYPADACVKGAKKKKGSPFSTERYGIGMAKGDTASIDAANAALTKMLATPPGGGDSAWMADLRESLGDEEAQRMLDRASQSQADAEKAPPVDGKPASPKYVLMPKVGDLAFVTAASTKC